MSSVQATYESEREGDREQEESLQQPERAIFYGEKEVQSVRGEPTGELLFQGRGAKCRKQVARVENDSA